MIIKAIRAAALVLPLSVATALGLLLASALLGPGGVIAVAIMGAVVGAVSHAIVAAWPCSNGRRESWRAVAVSSLPPRLWRSALYGALVLVCLAGGFASLGPAGGTGITVLATTAALAFWAFKVSTLLPVTAVAPAHAISSNDLDEAAVAFDTTLQATAGTIRGWSNDELCHAWRRSFVRLTQARGAGLRTIFAERGAYLDELERRNPTGFAAWLASGARAASNPGPYLITSHHDAHPSARPQPRAPNSEDLT